MRVRRTNKSRAAMRSWDRMNAQAARRRGEKYDEMLEGYGKGLGHGLLFVSGFV